MVQKSGPTDKQSKKLNRNGMLDVLAEVCEAESALDDQHGPNSGEYNNEGDLVERDFDYIGEHILAAAKLRGDEDITEEGSVSDLTVADDSYRLKIEERNKEREEQQSTDILTRVVPLSPKEVVDSFVQAWIDLNSLPPGITRHELYDQCIESECLVLTVLDYLDQHPPRFLKFFKVKLEHEGYQVINWEHHYAQATYFIRLILKSGGKPFNSITTVEYNRLIASESTLHDILKRPFNHSTNALTHYINSLQRNFPPRPFEYSLHRLRAVNGDILAAPFFQDSRKDSIETPHEQRETERTIIRFLVEFNEHENSRDDIKTREFSFPPLLEPPFPYYQPREPISPPSEKDPPPSYEAAAMSHTQVNLPLPVLPEGWSADKDFKAISTLSAASQRTIEPVGPHFLAHARRARHKRTFSEDDKIQAQENVKKVEDDDAGEISEPEDPMMLSRDAKDWKGQDHYAVLGLSKYRYKASEEQIKRAHRKKVLRHHPDKKAAAGSTEDDSFFKCIQKATEVLLDPVKRRQFDSVDEHAEVEPPTKKQTQKGNFYKLWSPVFRAEARFSKIQPVPKLGDENSTREDVEAFYNFWYAFDSWRSFEYQDEDVPDDNENRDQKRHVEKKNNNARKKKKTEDSARLRKLVDDCLALDERIKKFKTEANAAKNKKRLDKEAAEKKAIEDAKAKKIADEEAAKKNEEAAKVERELAKKGKEAAKTAVKKNKRVLKGSVKDANYFVKGDPPAATIDGVLNDVEAVQGQLDPDDLAALAAKLNGLKVADEIKGVWATEVKRLVDAGKLKEGSVKLLV